MCDVIRIPGVSDAKLLAEDLSCASYLSTATPCELGCCDSYPLPIAFGDNVLSCSLWMTFGMTCAIDTVVFLCPETCGGCPPPPSPPVHETSSTPTSGLVDLPISFGSYSSDLTTIEVSVFDAPGFVPAAVLVPMVDGITGVGAVALATGGCRNRAFIETGGELQHHSFETSA